VSGRSSRPTDSQEKALEGDINDSKAKSDLILSISHHLVLSSMNVTKYLELPCDLTHIGPHTFECTNSSRSFDFESDFVNGFFDCFP